MSGVALRLATALLAALLVAAALALVLAQYRSRQVFAELEVAQQETRTLVTDGAQLRTDLGRAAQPATVEAVARRMGMRGIDPNRIVILPPSVADAAAEAAADADAPGGASP